MEKNYLLITLGHGSSAIFVDFTGFTEDEPRIIGYEQERLSRIKSDSQFPVDAINEIMRNVPRDHFKDCKILISHWFNFSYPEDIDYKHIYPLNKYITDRDFELLKSISDDIEYVNPEFTHHDAHAYSAYAFFMDKVGELQFDYLKRRPLYCIVADGFGNNKEVFSIYRKEYSKEPTLIHRTYGYEYSLGLFYQYATSFVGMKENQDEYKFLGYEANISDYCLEDSQFDCLNQHIKNTTKYFVRNILNSTEPIAVGENLIDYTSLNNAKAYWNKQFDTVLSNIAHGCEYYSGSDKSRTIIAYFIQNVVENVLKEIIVTFGIEDVCVAGGCFYNVKLNNSILTSISGLFSAMPLAGDQGAAIGMYVKSTDKCFNFGSLCYGARRLYNIEKIMKGHDRFMYVNDDDYYQSFHSVAESIAQKLADGEIVNLIFGNMEFGPRALCHTSTLMLPTKENVAKTNTMNMRNEVMPCAPVMLARNAMKMFREDELARVVGSDYFMICTFEYKKPFSKSYGGVMHNIPMTDKFTGRPQIVDAENSFMGVILSKVEEICDAKCLVNTSFNVHGNPIVFDTMDIVSNYNFQVEHAPESKDIPYLYVIE